MKMTLDTATNLLVIAIALFLVCRPGGPASDAWTDWKSARRDRALADRYWDVLTSDVATLGNPGGEVAMVEFTDYQCPYCRRMDLVKERAGAADIRIAVRHLPLADIHPNAELAAAISVCTEADSVSWPRVHRALYQVADSLDHIDWRRMLRNLVVSGITDVVACVDSEEVRRRLAKDERLATAMGLTGTPGYVLPHGVRRGMISEEGIREIVR